jgi:hypothetical protein
MNLKWVILSPAARNFRLGQMIKPADQAAGRSGQVEPDASRSDRELRRPWVSVIPVRDLDATTGAAEIIEAQAQLREQRSNISRPSLNLRLTIGRGERGLPGFESILWKALVPREYP